MIAIAHLQDYLRSSARQRYDVQSIPPFTLFLHPVDDLTFFNYAIPDRPVGAARGVEERDALARSLARMVDAFGARGRVPRFEYLEEYAPDLGRVLEEAGFCEEARQPFMVCTPDITRPAQDVPGLSIEILGPRATLAQARAFWGTQRLGFDPGAEAQLSDEEAEGLLGEIRGETLLLGRMQGEPACAGMIMSPSGGIVELAGLTTLAPYRRRGIASAVTANALRLAFERGMKAVCLTAEDDRAGGIYARLGFVAVATACALRKET